MLLPRKISLFEMGEDADYLTVSMRVTKSPIKHKVVRFIDLKT